MTSHMPDMPKPATAGDQTAAQAQSKLAQAFALHQQGQLAQAQILYEQVLRLQPTHFGALHLLGVIAAQTGQFQTAVDLIGKAIEISPAFAEAYSNRGNALRDLGQPDAALASYDKAIALKPAYAEAYNNRGNALRDLGQPDAALASYDRAIALEPDYAMAHYNRGNALRDLRHPDAALAAYDRAIALNPAYADAYNSRGNAHRDLGQLDAALSNYDKAIALDPACAEAYNNRGLALHDLKSLDAALASYDKAIALKPDYAEAYNNRGIALQDLKRLNAALASYEKTIALKPDYAEAYNNRGNAYKDLGQLDAALENYDRAIALKPDCAEAYNNRGNVLRYRKQLDAALADYDKAMALKPEHACLYLDGIRLHTKMQMCDWSEFDLEVDRLVEKIDRHENASTPFPVLALSNSLELQQKTAEIWALGRYPASHALAQIAKHPRHEKLRIGYFSADFGDHPVSRLTAELFETHDRTHFEIHGFSMGPETNDAVRQRIKAGFDRFFDVHSESDQAVALLSRNHEIDIAVDLGGFTEHSRPGIFALRAAPIQVNYLGYLGTMGAPYMDYLVADRTIVPAAQRKFYAEKIAYVPSYQPNDTKRQIADRMFTRRELGLPETGFVYCCFNNNFKITPGTFDGWMRILKRVQGSVLLLYADNERAAINLKQAAVLRGIDAERIVFGKRLAAPEYLARYRLADLFLDTLPYNAGTTASDALWAGLPVLTRLGETFAGRVAASLLHAIGLPELIASTQEEFEALAIELATRPHLLVRLKQKLADNRLTTPLFDTPLFTRHLEAAYTQMHERHHADLPPEHLYIDP